MKKMNEDLKYLILLVIIVFAAVIPTFAHHGNFIIDCGREAYYPTQVLLGKVLYKDIFNIYGPFAYLFNALLYKIFGINLNVLYAAGCVSTVLISGLIYLIAKRFLSQFLSFSIAVFTVLTGVLTPYLSNLIFPYSYAMVYGLVAFLASVLYLLKYETAKDSKYLYLSSLFAGMSIACKYEFIPYLAVIIFAMIRVKPLGFKQIINTVLSLLTLPILCFGILLLQGLSINDILNTLMIYKKMSQSATLQYFYHQKGVNFNSKMLQYGIFTAFQTLLPLAAFYAGFKVKNKWISSVLIAMGLSFILLWTSPYSFSLLPILVVVLALVDFKNLKNDTALQLLTLSAILFSIKTFWGLIIADYGLYFIGFLLITITALAKDKVKDINLKTIGIYFIIIASVISYKNMATSGKCEIINTTRGKICINYSLYDSTKKLIDYINENTKKTDSIVILPEGAMINFLTQRPTDNYYTSLIPLYVETFGESDIINHFKATKPEYIIFNNWDTSEYYFKYICQDYAVSFCNYVAKNYNEEKIIGKDFRYIIFKKK